MPARLEQGATFRSAKQVLARLRDLGDPKARAGMARFGIRAKKAYGVATPKLKKLAREIGKDHRLAQQLWATSIHDARHLAALVDEPRQVTPAQMERWARQFDSWDVVDGCCCHLFVSTPFAWEKAIEWSRRKEEFVRRAGFALMAYLAVHDKRAADAKFVRLFPLLQRASTDKRHFVKKAVNWALRQIGKRKRRLNALAIRTAKDIRKQESSGARWIAADALRELTSPAVKRRLGKGR